MTENKFKPGDRIRHQYYSKDWVVVGYLKRSGKIVVESLDDGHPAYFDTNENQFELIPEPRKVSGWVNVYNDKQRSFMMFDTREGAVRNQVGRGAIAVYMSGTEGEEP